MQEPNEALAYLEQIRQQRAAEARQLGRIGARQELLGFCVNWYDTARTWRKSSYEDDWLTWQRHSDGRYDPKLASKKKDWQAKEFVDLTPSHRETIHAELFRLVAGSRPIMAVNPRQGVGDPDSAENIEDISHLELEKCKFEQEYNAMLEDRTTYGTAILQYWFETEYQDRIVKVPQYEQVSLADPGSIKRAMMGQRQVIGYANQTKQTLVYRGIRLKHIPIWDFFWDPKSLSLKGAPALHRSYINLQTILDKVKAGEFMAEAAREMQEQATNEQTPSDKAQLQSERQIADSAPKREGNQKTWEYYNFFVKLPQKWVYPLLKEPLPVDDADKLVPARVIFTKNAIFAVELNQDYDGEAPFLKDDYMPVPMRFMGRGIPEMLKNSQRVVNAIVNQRLDEGALALEGSVAVIEKAIKNPQELESGGPGQVIRLDQKALGPNGDVRNGIMPLERPDVKINAGFVEVHEWERMAQERTSANRATLGTNGLVHDANRTLGGQQLLKMTAGEKFAFIQMLSEYGFMHDLFRAIWKLIYLNYGPDDVLLALGPQKAQTFVFLSPEEVNTAYRYEAKGIFEREAKATLQARLAAMKQQFGMEPWFDNLANYQEQMKSFGMDPDRLMVPQAEAMEIMQKAQMMAQPMARQMVTEIILGQAVKDVERNLAEKMADDRDGAKAEKVAGVPDIGKPKQENTA